MNHDVVVEWRICGALAFILLMLGAHFQALHGTWNGPLPLSSIFFFFFWTGNPMNNDPDCLHAEKNP